MIIERTDHPSEKDIPDKVSWRVVDAWAAIPPCNPSISHPYCHVQCPYFYECYPEECDDEEFDDEEFED